MEHNHKATVISNASGIDLSFQSEFMKNYIAESVIDGGKGIRSLKVSEQQPALFFIDKDARLCLLQYGEVSNAGWCRHYLSPEGGRVTSFDIYYCGGQFRISYSLVRQGHSELLVSEPVQLDAATYPGMAAALHWQQKQLQQPDREINHITMGRDGVLFSSLKTGTDALYHYFDYAAQPQAYTLPENTHTVRQLNVGCLYDMFGVFILYDMPGGERTLLFKSFVEEYGSVTQFRYGIDSFIHCFDLLQDEEGNHTLFAAGRGIYMVEDTYNSVWKTVAEGHREYTGIEVSRNGDELTVWALAPEGGRHSLYYLTNHYFNNGAAVAGEQWTAPLKMQERIDSFTSIKGDHWRNQLFVFDGSSTLTHLWQDAVSLLWQEQPLVIPDLNSSREVDTFTIEIIGSSDDLTRGIDPIALSAAENVMVYINNHRVALLAGAPVEVKLEGPLHIMMVTDTLAVPALTIDAPFLDAPVTVDPAATVRAQIKEKIRSGGDLRQARKQDGSPLVAGSYDDDTLNGVADAIGHAVNTAEKLDKAPRLEQDAAIPADADFVSISELRLAAPPRVQGLGSMLSYVGNAIGDIYHSVKKGFNTVTRFVIEQAGNVVRFVIEIGGKVINWVVNAVKDAIAFLERVWEKIKVFFKDLVEFLSFLFNWQDILDTKEALVGFTRKLVKGLEENLVHYKMWVNDKLQELKTDLVRRQDSINIKYDYPISQHKGGQSSVVTWISSKKDYIAKGKTEDSSDVTGVVMGEVSKALAPLAPYMDMLNNVFSKFSDLGSKFMDVFSGKMGIGDFLQYFLLVMAELGIELAQQIVGLIFDALILVVKGIDAALYGTIEVPLFSALYRKITGKELSFSIMDFLCLIIAIPATAAAKLAEGKAPFEDAKARQSFIDSAGRLFSIA